MSTGFAMIGRFAVRFRWLIVAVWVIGTIAATSMLPSLDSVTQDNNANFLPSSSASIQAAMLGSAIGATTQSPIPVVVARANGPLTSSDAAALIRLEAALETAGSVVGVRDLGLSSDGHAEELEVIARGLGGGGLDLKAAGVIDGLRAKIQQAALPAGLQAHLAGDVATQVDNQANDGANAMMDVSMVFIVVLLLFIFRALLAPVLTLIPAGLAVLLAQPLIAEWGHHGLQVAQIAQLLMIVLVLALHGLRAVPRVQSPRGTARRAAAEGRGRACARPGRRVDHLLCGNRHSSAASFAAGPPASPSTPTSRYRLPWALGPCSSRGSRCCLRCWPSSDGQRSGQARYSRARRARASGAERLRRWSGVRHHASGRRHYLRRARDGSLWLRGRRVRREDDRACGKRLRHR